MKVSLHLWVFIALLSVGSMSAQVLQTLNAEYRLSPEATLTLPQPNDVSVFLNSKGDAPALQGLTYKRQYWTTFGAYFESFNDQMPFVYEAGTDKVFLLKPEPIVDQGRITGGKLRLLMSSNRGRDFNPGMEIASRDGTVFLLQSLTVSNPGNQTTDPNDLNWLAYAAKYVYNPSAQNFQNSGQVALFNSSGTPFQYDMDDVQGAPGNFLWGTGDLAGYGGDNPTAYMAGQLDAQDPGAQYGTYGTWSFDYPTENFPMAGVPTPWDNSQFLAAPSTTQTYNGKPQIGVDSDGSAYVVVNNIFADDPNVRVPAVSISENQGVDWTAFDRMPVSMLNDYMSQFGWDNIIVYGPYHSNALAVTAPGKFSYFFRVLQSDPNDQNVILNIDLVEASYDNGVWTLARVAELKGTTPPVFLRAEGPSDAIGPNAWLPEYQVNPQGNEIDVALTADGMNILLKWIDIDPAKITVFNPPIDVFFNQNGTYVSFALDSLAATDVYIANRSVSGTNWSAPVNLTNDDNYDHGTKIPDIIPDLENVPFMTSKTILKSEYNTQSPWYNVIRNMPDVFLSANVDYRTPNGINTAVFNALNVNSVADDERQLEFRINDVSPNPASESAALSFTMDKPGSVSIDIFSVTGSVVQNIYNGRLSAGPHGINVRTSELSSGSYYVVLNVDGAQIAHHLAVLK